MPWKFRETVNGCFVTLIRILFWFVLFLIFFAHKWKYVCFVFCVRHFWLQCNISFTCSIYVTYIMSSLYYNCSRRHYSMLQKTGGANGGMMWSLVCTFLKKPGVMTCYCNPATLETEFRNGVGSIPVGGNSPSIGGWIVWPPITQH